MKAIKYNDVNLYLKYIEDPEKEKRRRTVTKMVLPVVMLIIVAAAVIALLVGKIIMLQADELYYSSMLDDSELNEQYDEAYYLENETRYYSSLLDGLKKFDDAKNSYPDVTTDVIKNLYDCNDGSVQITNISYSSADGALLINATADGELKVSDYVGKLRKSGKYEFVSYAGYTRAEDGGGEEDIAPVAEDGSFDVEIACVLKVKESEATAE